MENINIFNLNQRDIRINNIFLRRKNKIIFQNDKVGDFNAINKEKIEQAIKNDAFLSNSKYDIKVKQCQLLHCILTIDNCDVEFENGKICSFKSVGEEIVMEKIKKVMKKENSDIQNKLILPLTFNENLISLGFCLSIELFEVLTCFTLDDFERFNDYLLSELRKIKDKKINYNPSFPAFPFVTLKKEAVYNSYYKWLHQLLIAKNYDNHLIPRYYQSNINTAIPKKVLTVISIGDEEEFCDVIKNLMNTPKTFTNIKISDIHTYIHEFFDFLTAIPETFTNIENLTYVVLGILNFLDRNTYQDPERTFETNALNLIYNRFDQFEMNMDDIIVVTLLLSGNHKKDINNFNCYWHFPYKGVDIILKYLNKLDGKTRYNGLLKNKHFWVKFGKTVQIMDYKESYPEVINELLDVQKIIVFNKILMKNHKKWIIEKSSSSDLDFIYQKNIERDIRKIKELNEMNICVKKCDLLSCVLTYKNRELIYEDGVILNPQDIADNYYLKTELNNIMEVNTEIIRKKLIIPLTFVEIAYDRGFCLDTDVVKRIAAYSNYELEIFNYIFEYSFNNFGSRIRRRCSYSFQKNRIPYEDLYCHYCKWLYFLEFNKYDPQKIPSNYKVNFEDYVRYENLPKNPKYIIIQAVDDTSEFYQMITKYINSPEAISDENQNDIELFITYEKDHFKYFPETITNKENLANISNIIINYYEDHPPLDFLISKYTNINDVLRLALVRSNHNASDLGRSCRFKSFSNKERRLFMALMNHCKNRYEDILMYKPIWVRFCEKIHPVKFKKVYPDLVDDLMGNYRVLGSPKNKPIRMEYRFYQDLYKLDETLKKYKIELIQYVEKNVHSLNISNNTKELLIKQSNMISVNEHQSFLKRLKEIHCIPENCKTPINDYLLKLSGIVYTGILKYMIQKFINNKECIEWDSNQNKNKIKKDYEDIHSTLSQQFIYYINNMIPGLDKEFIEKRIQEIQPFLAQLQKQNQQYKRDHQSFNSKCVELLRENRVNEAAELLAKKPGIFIRHLNELLTKGGDESVILEFFEKIAQKSSIKVLLSIKGYFQNRYRKMDHQAFLVKGSSNDKRNYKNRTVIYSIDEERQPLSEEVCQRILHITDEALKLYFSSKSSMNGVFIHYDLQKFLIPMDMRQKSQSFETYSKGSRFNLSFKNITEEEKKLMVDGIKNKINLLTKKEKNCNIEKKEIEIEVMNSEIISDQKVKTKLMNKYYQKKREIENLVDQISELKLKLEERENCPVGKTYDIVRFFVTEYADLYIEVYDADFQFKTIITGRRFINYNNNEYGIYFGSDQCQYADIDIRKVLEHQGRYIVVTVGQCFNYAKFGWMERPYVNAKERFDPNSVQQYFSLIYDNDACPFILDCESRELIWVDYLLTKNNFMNNFLNAYECYHNMIQKMETMNEPTRQETYPEDIIKQNTENYNKMMKRNSSIKRALLYYYLDPMRISIASLLQLHIEARGGKYLETEEELQKGDKAFVTTVPYIKKENVEYVDCKHLEVILSEYMN
jgi:hypothetical protein